MIGIGVGSSSIATDTIRYAVNKKTRTFSMKEWEIEQIIFIELIAEPADGLTYEAIFMLPEFLEQDVDPEVIGYCLSALQSAARLGDLMGSTAVMIPSCATA